MRYLLILFSSLSMILSNDVTLSFANVTNTSADIVYESSADIGGFQFNYTGVTLVTGGATSEYFAATSFSASNQKVLGFSFRVSKSLVCTPRSG